MKFGLVLQEEMSFKDISYLELWHPLCSENWNHLCKFGTKHHEEQFRNRFLLKDFLSGALAALLFSGAEQLCNFDRGHQGEHSCEVL